MSLQDEIRADLQAEVFGEFGKTVQKVVNTAPVKNDWGEIESYTETTTNIVVVPYDIIQDRRNPQPFGELKEGDMAVAVPYDTPINKSDILIIDSLRYKISEISKNFLPDNVVTILRVSQQEIVTSA
jgi:hypothetical protein